MTDDSIYPTTKSLSNTPTDLSIKKTAAALTKNGIPVFPCLPNKSPATPNGFKDACLDANRFDWESNSLIGVPTGILFDVLDIDYQHREAQEWVEQHENQLPETRIHKTRSGGFHFFFQADSRVGNTTARIGKHIDTRGKGGYIIWWSALGLEVANPNIIAPWSDWLLEELLKQGCTYATNPEKPTNNQPVTQYEIMAALDSIDAGCDYTTWFQVLVALKAELGDSGFMLARDWSKTSNKYSGDAKFARKWQSIVPQRLTIRSVFYFAKKANPRWKQDFTNKIFSSTGKEII